jgi:hypothetical protein
MLGRNGIGYHVPIVNEVEQMGGYNVRLGEMDYVSRNTQNKMFMQLCGEVKTITVLDNIYNVKSLKELENMPYERARKHIMTAKQFHSTRRLIQYWHTNSTYVYKKLYPKFNIPKGKFVPGLIKDVNGNAIPKKRKKFNARVNEVLTAEQLIERLTKFASMAKGGKFNVNIKIEELTGN